MRTKFVVLLAVSFLWLGVQKAQSGEDAQPLLEKTSIKGGLCLIIGAKDTSLPEALAKGSALYVQTLQPDAKVAAQWGLVVASSTNRENIGIRNAAFYSAHYDTDLFNLIVFEDAQGLGKAKLADLYRILVPNGFVAFKSVPEGFAAEAKTLKMDALAAGSFQAIYKKPVPPVEWKPSLSRKWSAGPNAGNFHYSFGGMTSGGGKFFYREAMEVEGERWKEGQSQLFARDAYNGRTLWTQEEPVGSGLGAMAADNKGRLFVVTSDGKLVCLDADTGKQRFALMDKGAGGGVRVYYDKYVIACGKVFAAEDGKTLWTLPAVSGDGAGYQGVVDGEAIYYCDGKTLKTGNLADGKLQTFTLGFLPPKMNWLYDGGMVFSGRHLLIYPGGGRTLFSVDRTSGKLLWTWIAPWPVEEGWGGPPYLGGGSVFIPMGDKLVINRRPPPPPLPKGKPTPCYLMQLDLVTGKVDLEKNIPGVGNNGDGACGGFYGNLGDYRVDRDNWINAKTLERATNQNCHLPYGPCSIHAIPAKGVPLFFEMAQRKSRWVTAIASGADVFEPPKGPGWKNLQKFGTATSTEPTQESDWPMFRGAAGMGNFSKAGLGDKPVKAWDVQVGLGGKSFGMMSGQRIGLTQPVVAYGLAVVSDIEGQRIVACKVEDGKIKWVFHVGSQVDYSPTLYNGLCLFKAKDGWVYCLDAKTGALVWRNLVYSAERYIGGHEQLESYSVKNYNGFEMPRHIQVVDGLGCVDSTDLYSEPNVGPRCYARQFFCLETGEPVPVPKNPPVGRHLSLNHQFAERVVNANSLPRQYAENAYEQITDGRIGGYVVAFDDALSVAYSGGGGEADWRLFVRGIVSAVTDNPDPKNKKGLPLWSSTNLNMVVDDIVLTPQRLYAVGHYQRSVQKPELLVMAREDGKVIHTVPVDGFPGFLGMSAAGNRLFVATREGKLICYQGEK